MKQQLKVLVCDRLAEEGLKALSDAGLKVDYRPEIALDELLSLVGEYDALLVRSRTKVTGAVIDRAIKLKAIGRAGVGLDNIDVKAARARGISVINSPESLTNAVAELVLGLMISLARGIPKGHCSLREGRWIKDTLVGTELSGKVLGIVGFGRIGRRLAELVRPFGMKVLAYDIAQPDPATVAALGVNMCSLEELLSTSDFVTLHVPGGKETAALIDGSKLALMKKNAYLINTSRGEVVDEDALVNALKSGVIKGAALDVYRLEPPTNRELLSLENVVLTPHIGGQTYEAQVSASVTVADKLIRELLRAVP